MRGIILSKENAHTIKYSKYRRTFAASHSLAWTADNPPILGGDQDAMKLILKMLTVGI